MKNHLHLQTCLQVNYLQPSPVQPSTFLIPLPEHLSEVYSTHSGPCNSNICIYLKIDISFYSLSLILHYITLFFCPREIFYTSDPTKHEK